MSKNLVNIVVAKILAIFILAPIGAFVGYALGQYYPAFSGTFAMIAEPHSPLRNEVAKSYMIVGALVGSTIGLFVSGITRHNRLD